jgi:type II secretory pathway pseudopilin PulG
MANCPNCGTQLNASTDTCPQCTPAAPPALPPPMPRAAAKTRWGLIVAIGCAALIPIVGIIAAIAIPNFVDALSRAKVKRTMADIRNLGVALESYRADNNGAVPEGDTIAALAAGLEPVYILTVPRQDGWLGELRYQCWSELGEAACDTYRLASAGKDGIFEHEDLRSYGQEETPPNAPERDIVYGDGFFLQLPGGR